MSDTPKMYVAYGPGFSGGYDTFEEARAVVRTNGAGSVYMCVLCPVCGSQMSEGPADFNICSVCLTEFGYDDAGRSIEQLRREWQLNTRKDATAPSPDKREGR